MGSAGQALTAACIAGLLMVAGCAAGGGGGGFMLVPLPAKVALATPEQDNVAKRFSVPADKAGLYIYRNEIYGAAWALPLFIDGNLIGRTAYKTYAYVELPAGEHVVTSKSEGEPESSVVVHAVGGKTYFVWQEIKTGTMRARGALQLVDEPTGRAGVLESTLIAF